MAVTAALAGCVAPAQPAGPDAAPAGQGVPLSGDKHEPVRSCIHSTAEARPLELEWGFTGIAQFSTGAPLRVRNPASSAVAVVLEARLVGANADLRQPPQRFTLAAGATQEVVISTAALADLATPEDTPFTAMVSATVPGGTAWAEQRSLHRTSPGGPFAWYPTELAREHNRAVIERLAEERGVALPEYERELVDTMQLVLEGQPTATSAEPIDASPIGFGAPTWPAPGGPGLPGDEGQPPPPPGQTVCFRHTTDYVEGGVDFASQAIYPAKGAKIWLTIPTLGTWFGMTSRTTGCVSFPALPPGALFFMGMYSEIHVGNDPDRDIMVRAFDGAGTGESWTEWDGTPWGVPRNAYAFLSLGDGTSVTVTSAPGRWKMANILAVAGEMLQHVDDEVGDPTPWSASAVFASEDCPSIPDSGCYVGNGLVFLSNHDNHIKKTEVSGHETGHLIRDFYDIGVVSQGAVDYGYEDPAPACAGWGQTHALYSKEYQTAAYNEGLAHALSAYLLSDSSLWKYYKNIPLSPYTNQVIVLDDAATFDYLERECTGVSMEGYGVEADWLRFLWDYWRTSGVSLADFIEHSKGMSPMGKYDAYEKLRMAIPGGPLRHDFENRAALHGVDAQ